MSELVLEMCNISKSFNSVNVLNNVGFQLKKGEIHALMGGNGAGKSTLMKILTGVYSADSGEILIEGKKAEINNYNEAIDHKISMIFQEFSLVPTLTVAQNIFLNREDKTKLGLINDKECIKKTAKLLQELGVDISPVSIVQDLGVGFWQMTEIAKSLSQEAKILIMDEPTSSLTEKETDVLFDFMERLKNKGISIIYISHRMEEIFKICDRITVLRDGENIITEDCENTDLDTVISHIVGGEVASFEWKERDYSLEAPPLLQVKNLNVSNQLENIEFYIQPGEVLGVAGLMGSGRTELVRALFGIDHKDSGDIYINGEKKLINNQQDAIKANMALLPEDRRVQGLVLQHSVKDNMVLPIIDRVKKGLLVNEKIANNISNEYVDRLNIKTDNIYKQISLLSGGNQQKVVLAKWLATEPDILLLDEPTIGVDIGAKTEIIEIIRLMANSGKAILVISSELNELLAVSDKIMVMHKGKISKTINRKDIASEEEIQYAIQGY
ncbi:sugar ABC transporter ATP-binding protein [Gracilibacillus alcaliphilus]|uniref:sugar ABC transporter ATP-binding protein n=1 Tax=Gracilibacillus alcaliphilus TaxID=1401441 RepID=UPI00195C8D73|nr:sugar ABC transporter ATP-binding protein [Gracilibacillus alcaliphilus]MBM7677601.1 ribose transport system ATP-binding protein [Gracilibacillus alcaliphilus]